MHRWIKTVSLNLAFLAFGVIGLELVFGSWLATKPLNQLLIARNANVYYTIDGLAGSWTARYTNDEWGLRGSYPSIADIDVLTIGGSTTDQRFIDDKETWQAVIQANSIKDGTPIHIASAGVDGQTTSGQLYAFSVWFDLIPDLKPKWILAYIGANEVDRPDEFDAMVSDNRGLKHAIIENSAIYRLYRVLRGMVIAERYGLNHNSEVPKGDWRTIAMPTDGLSSADQRNLAGYPQRLTALSQRIHQFGATPIFVTQPLAHFRPLGDRLAVRGDGDIKRYAVLRKLNDTLLSSCESLKAICIDLERELTFGDEDFYDIVHNTPSGTRKIGDYLYSKLKPIIGEYLQKNNRTH